MPNNENFDIKDIENEVNYAILKKKFFQSEAKKCQNLI